MRSQLVETLRKKGIELRIVVGDLQLDAPPDVLSAELVGEVRSRKKELVVALEQEKESVEKAWELAIEEIAFEWEAIRARHGDHVPWLDDDALQDALGDAMRSGDCDAAYRLIAAWWNAWQDCFEEFLRRNDLAYHDCRLRAQRASARRLADWIEDPEISEADREIYELEMRARAMWLFRGVERSGRSRS